METASMPPRVILALAAALPCALSAALDPDLVAESRRRMTTYTAAMPDYVCSVSIDRYRKPERGKEKLTDRVKLEVAYVGGRELYGLAGATRFEDVPIRQLVRGGGSMSTGSYALHMREVFTTNRARFTAAERLKRQGRDAVRIAFTVPRDRSKLTVSDGGGSATVGYSGEAWFEPETWAPLELLVVLDDIPAEITIARAQERILYQRVRIGGNQVSLPASTDLSIVSRQRSFTRNATTFQNCRQYRAESTVSFDEPPPDPAVPAAPPAPLTVEPGSLVTVELWTPIGMDAAIGERVTAAVTDMSGALPRGALVTGNIVRMRKMYRQNREWHWIGLRFTSAESSGRSAALRARIVDVRDAASQLGRILASDRETDPPDGETTLLADSRRMPLRRGLRLVLRIE